jgi:hypothetical protein
VAWQRLDCLKGIIHLHILRDAKFVPTNTLKRLDLMARLQLARPLQMRVQSSGRSHPMQSAYTRTDHGEPSFKKIISISSRDQDPVEMARASRHHSRSCGGRCVGCSGRHSHRGSRVSVGCKINMKLGSCSDKIKRCSRAVAYQTYVLAYFESPKPWPAVHPSVT